EAYYRFIFDETDSLALSNATIAWHVRHVRPNNIGVWDDVDYADAIPAGKRRIAFVGDSFTAGHGVDQLPDHFPMLLRARHPEGDVVLVAFLGWDTGQEVTAVRNAHERGFGLDVVVVVYCLNDIGDLIPEWQSRSKALSDEFSHLGYFLDHSFFLNT